jgi:uncharacterized membrane protein YjfL (UPF0719 family)
MLEILTNLLTYIPFYAYALLLAFAGCYFYRKTCRFSFTEELTVRDNPAFGACLAGYLIGLVTALAAAFPMGAESLADAFISMTYSGLLAIVLMRASIYVNGRFILSKFCINEEMLRDRNVGTGLAVAGSSIATGLILAGALTGESDSNLLAIRDIVIYWALGQVLLIGGAALFFATAGYNVHSSLEHQDNPATGASLAGFLVSLGILLGAILRNSSSSIVEELSITAIEVVIGGALLLLTRFVTERLIMPRANFIDEIAVQKNTAAGMMSATASIVTALLLAAAVVAH